MAVAGVTAVSDHRTFGSSVEASNWAYAYLRSHRGHVKAPSTFREVLSEGAMKVKSMFSRDDDESIALTIAAVIERVHPLEHQAMFRYLFGDRDDTNVMALYLQDALVQQGVLRDRHHNVINTVIAQLLRRQRSWAHRERSKVDVNDLAKVYRMRKDTFKQKCVRPLEETMRMWQDMGDRKITDELSDKGVIV